MKNRTGFIARLSGVRRLRLVASITLCLMAGTGLTVVCLVRAVPPAIVTSPLPALDIAAWTADAKFDRPASVLNTKDRALYYRIFTLQAQGHWREADLLIAALDDPLLMGHVLYQRYLTDPNYRSGFAELNRWLQEFGDLPNADRVHRLAGRRRTVQDADLVALKLPAVISLRRSGNLLNGLMKSVAASRPDAALHGSVAQSPAETRQANQLAASLKTQLANGRPGKALDSFNSHSQSLSAPQRGVLLTQIAMGLYQSGKFSHARLVGLRAQREQGAHQTIASWIAGLASWQSHDYAAAQSSFARIADNAHAETIDPWFYTAGAYWAARAAGKQGDLARRADYLQKAGRYPTTFYGLLAHGALGRTFKAAANDNDNDAPAFTAETVATLVKQPCGERVLALLDAGQKDMATAELQHWLRAQIDATDKNSVAVRQAMYATVHEFQLAGVQQIAAATHDNNNVLKAVYTNDDLFPVLQNAVGTHNAVDPALIHALIRQESRFDPKARNKVTGATGLMQLMPETARFIGDAKIDGKALQNPATNLALGQRYVDYLLRQPYIKGNLMYLAVAYNAGPGNLQAWQGKIGAEKDPLLFIESLPFGQTRAFVEHVMANYWIYRLRLGHDVTDVQQLVDGAWPHHVADQTRSVMATQKGPPVKPKMVQLNGPSPKKAQPVKPVIEDARLRDRFDLASAQ